MLRLVLAMHTLARDLSYAFLLLPGTLDFRGPPCFMAIHWRNTAIFSITSALLLHRCRIKTRTGW